MTLYEEVTEQHDTARNSEQEKVGGEETSERKTGVGGAVIPN